MLFLSRAPQRPYRSPVTKRQSEDGESKMGDQLYRGLRETASLTTGAGQRGARYRRPRESGRSL